MNNVIRRNKKTLFLFILTLIITLFFIEQIAFKLGELGEAIEEDFTTIIAAVIFSLLSLYFYYFPKLKTNFIFNRKISFFVYYISLIYIYLRFIYKSLYFAPYTFSLKFSDVIIVLFLSHSAVLIKTIVKERELTRPEGKKKNTSFFLEDSLFIEEEIDNEKILNQLIETLKNFRPEHSFSIGLNGVWGYGKSSFLKRFEKEYKFHNPNSIIFWNHIWKNKGSQAIIENFFEELKENLKPFSSSISNDIDKYVDAVLSVGATDITKYLKSGMTFFAENDTLEKYYNEINRNINVIDRQIIILLDDLDRLEREEILNALKLIRTISDFKNVIFIAGYDRKYIINTIDKEQKNFLDKIFNVEINLIPFDEQLIVDELFRQVDKIDPLNEGSFGNEKMKKAFKTLFEDDESNQQFTFVVDTSNVCSNHDLRYQDFLKTYRDVKRFVNEFKFNSSFLESEENVIAEEYILLKLCTYRFRDVQNLIFSKIPSVLSSGIIDEVNEEIRQFGGSSNSNVYLYDKKSKGKVNELLSNYSEGEKEVINSVLCRLFSEKTIEFYQENPNSISKIYYTDIYVRNNIVAGQLSVSQLLKAFEENQLYRIAEELSVSTKQSKFQITNEIRQFIYNNKFKITKNQFIDLLKTLNFIILNSTVKDDENTFEIFHIGSSQHYQENKKLLAVLNKVLEVIPLGYLDRLFSELAIEILKVKEQETYKSHLIRFNKGLFSFDEIINLQLKKLKYLIDSKEPPQLVFRKYSTIPEEIISDDFILRAKEANELIKKDMENRFFEYLHSEVFDFYNGKLLNKEPLQLTSFSPKPLLAQIFSEPKTQNELAEKPNNEELLSRYTSEGWINLHNFISGIDPKGREQQDFKDLEKAKDFSKAFVKNNYNDLEETLYRNIEEQLPF